MRDTKSSRIRSTNKNKEETETMKKMFAMAAGLVICGLLSVATANAQVYNQNIVAIFGSGNPDTGWTEGSGPNGLVLALRAKDRTTASTANTEGVYLEAVGVDPAHLNRAGWNFEISVNSGDVNLDAYDYYLGVDTDTSVGVSNLVLNFLTGFSDNAYGNNSTPNGMGATGASSLYAPISNVAQQSQNIVFYGLNPNVDATYDYVLYAVAKGAGPDGKRIASVSITVVVGAGGATVQQLIDDLAVGATNHGDYVKSVDNLLKSLNDQGVINKKEKASYLSAAAQSSVGK